MRALPVITLVNYCLCQLWELCHCNFLACRFFQSCIDGYWRDLEMELPWFKSLDLGLIFPIQRPGYNLRTYWGTLPGSGWGKEDSFILYSLKFLVLLCGEENGIFICYWQSLKIERSILQAKFLRFLSLMVILVIILLGFWDWKWTKQRELNNKKEVLVDPHLVFS